MRRFGDVYIGGSYECSCNRIGNILIPQTLKDYTSIKREIVIVGVDDHFEIFSQNIWKTEGAIKKWIANYLITLKKSFLNLKSFWKK
ncbi:MAG: division/cell wall cluster transcriptional repressor MraZ [Proteobacteria bacterium]|nr:division/cell wall cluster transcriptional repressor MraZ [Pseudomonadota bacterium]